MKNDNIRINKECCASEISDRILLNLEIKDGKKYYKARTREQDIIKKKIDDILIKKLSNSEFNKIMRIIWDSDTNKKKGK